MSRVACAFLFSNKVVFIADSDIFLFNMHLLSELDCDELLVSSKASMPSFFFGRKVKFLMDLNIRYDTFAWIFM